MAEPHIELRNRIAQFRRALEPTFDALAAMIELELRARSELLDGHTLKELRRLGHPYRQAKGESYAGLDKHGKWRAGIYKKARQAREIFQLGHDIKLVHTQSGSLSAAIFRDVTIADDIMSAKAGVNPSLFPEIKYVVLGTRKMIPRDFIGIAAVAVKAKLFARLRQGIREAFEAR